jgi:tRNA modification GTPase
VDSFSDIIAAPITGVQRAPVALIRVSGEGSWEIAKRLMEGVGAEPRHAYFGSLLDAQGGEIDEGFLTLFSEGRSFTGEESFEVSCHGSPQTVHAVLSAIQDLGARAARPGEFSERAFLNGRLDLTQAESVQETVNAATEAQRKRAADLRRGVLADKVRILQDAVGAQLALAEATVDFSDEIGELDRDASATSIKGIQTDIEGLLTGYRASRLIREGLRVALIGRPNVGKSSLLNALVGADRAIVTSLPGTTRDTIEETVEIAGYPVVLTDTAGIREGKDEVERLGVERSRAAVEAADEVWFICDSADGWTEEDEALASSLNRTPDLLIANKSDLRAFDNPRKHLAVSALTGAGLEAIAAHVIAAFETGTPESALINDRHEADLREANELLSHAATTLADPTLPTDLACVDLKGALNSLCRITGETAPDEIIERVFREFCIGK